MKAPTKSELRSFLDRLKASIKQRDARLAVLAEGRAAQAKFNSTLEKLGMPHYQDDAAIQQVAITQLKKKSCETVIEKVEGELHELEYGESRHLIEDGGKLAALVMKGTFEQRMAEISAAFRPFSESLIAARQAAENSDAGATAHAKLRNIEQLGHIFDYGDVTLPQIKEALITIEAVLKESLKESPNLQEFLSFTPSPDEQPPAVATA